MSIFCPPVGLWGIVSRVVDRIVDKYGMVPYTIQQPASLGSRREAGGVAGAGRGLGSNLEGIAHFCPLKHEIVGKKGTFSLMARPFAS